MRALAPDVDRRVRPKSGREIALLGVVLLVGCGSGDLGAADGPIDPSLPTAWTGSFEGGCTPGHLALFLEVAADGSHIGSLYYESADANANRGTYDVDVGAIDGRIDVRQTTLVQSDFSTRGWCHGTYSLQVEDVDGTPTLTGSYKPDDCSCVGTARFVPAG